jgi:competence protein ComFC
MWIDIFWPKSCELCGKRGAMICPKCLLELERATPRCPACGKESILGICHKKCNKKTNLRGLVSIFSYKDEKVAKIIQALKYDGRWAIIQELVCDIPRPEFAFDVVVYVPMHVSKSKQRGYNQAKLIAIYLAKRWRVPLINSLVKIKGTKSLAQSESLEDRRALVFGAYKYKGDPLNGKNVVLVDDVFTSGATMNEVAKELVHAGAANVWGWSIAS